MSALLAALVLAGSTIKCPEGTTLDANEGVSACYDKAGTTHGPFQVTDKKGAVLEKSQFVHGKLDGKAAGFYPNGKKRYEAEWKLGAPVGTHTDWFEDGKKASERRFESGLPDGEWLLFHRNGKVAWKRAFKAGALTAEQIFDESGQPAAGTGLPKSVLATVIRSYNSQVRACYEAELKGSPDLEGRVAVMFQIGKDGKVLRATALEKTIAEPVPTCIVDRVRKWQFPRPIGGQTIDVTYPWVFKRGD